MALSIDTAARHFQSGDLPEAAEACLTLLQDAPDHVDALHLLGVVLVRLDKPADAVGFLTQAIRLRPGDPGILTNLGVAWVDLGLYAEALSALLAAIQSGGTTADRLGMVGIALLRLHRPADAEDLLRQVVAQAPNHQPSRYTLGQARAEMGLLAQAADCFRALLDDADHPLDPSRRTDTVAELGNVLLRLGQPEGALALIVDERRRNPDFMLDWNESLVLLLLGHYPEGWARYEARWNETLHDPMPRGAAVLDPARVAGRDVLVLGEQGRGDIIQFARYAALLAERGARVTLSVPDDLTALLRTVPGVSQVVGPLDTEPEADFVTPVMSLPLAFGTALSTIPAAVPYVSASEVRVAAWRERLGVSGLRRIGVVWAGSASSHARSAMPVGVLEPLLRRSELECHGLSKSIRGDDRAWLARNPLIRLHDAELGDFADTAALIACMDLVVTIDTSVAHLAGAMGRPVWILLPFNPDFRWLTKRSSTPWYPTARLFRQKQAGDWDSVVSEVLSALALPPPAGL